MAHLAAAKFRTYRVTTLEDRIRLMKKMIFVGLRDPEMRKVALAVAAGDQWTLDQFVQENGYRPLSNDPLSQCASKAEECELENIYRFVKGNVRYTGDIAGVDTYVSARRSLFEFRAGDCDDSLVACSTLLAQNGYSCVARCVAGRGSVDQLGRPVIGHIYCPAPETRVLTLDLQWVPIGDLCVGRKLLAFDECGTNPRGASPGRRDLSVASIVALRAEKRDSIALHLSDGTKLVAAHDHLWLSRTKENCAPFTWMSTADLLAATNRRRGRRWLPKFFSPWRTLSDYDSGWLAGIFDGEGSLVARDGSYRGQDRRSGLSTYVLGFSQKPGRIADRAKAHLATLGFTVHGAKPMAHSGCCNFNIGGGTHEIFRALGELRPLRLLDKFERATQCARLPELRSVEVCEVVAAEKVGSQDVVVMQTSTGTYFAEGFGSHNCVALTPKFHPREGVALDTTLGDGQLGTEPARIAQVDFRLF